MKEKLIRFMQGRYGVDQFTRFLMGVALACMIISLFTRNAVWSFLILLVLVYSYFRMFSKNIQKRYAENQKYLQMTAGIRKKAVIQISRKPALQSAARSVKQNLSRRADGRKICSGT